MENYDFVLKGANIKIPKKITDNVITPNKQMRIGNAQWRKVKQMQPM